jgi:nitroimidazol reductase NimA-like FMN-containing flavoprotein (pyridoxamine 5'-phosphate oxidase superfamily)
LVILFHHLRFLDEIPTRGEGTMAPEHIHPRRKDRSKEEEWIRSLLNRGGACVLATIRGGLPHPIPVNFVYDEDRDAIYIHKGRRGTTVENVAQNDAVALTVFEMGRILPAPEASEFGVEYASVVVFGQARQVEDPEEALAALALLMEKYAPHLKAGEDYRPVTAEEVGRTVVLRVDIQAWSGKEKKEAPDYPGAYRLEDVR